MFDQERYPTPESVIDQMGIDCYGKVVLEPSAGSFSTYKAVLLEGREAITSELSDHYINLQGSVENIVASQSLF